VGWNDRLDNPNDYEKFIDDLLEQADIDQEED